jgi:L-fuconolactonase
MGAAMLIIDTHAHIYSEDAKKYPVMEKPFRPPPGKGTLTHLRAEMKNAGVRYAVAVHTKTFYNWDNRFAVDAAKANPEWMVGNVLLDPDDPHSVGQLERYVRDNNIKALRNIPAKNGKLDTPENVRLWEKCVELGIVVNVLVNRDKRDELTALLTRFRKLKVVLDHCMNLNTGPDMDKILADVVRLGRQPNLIAKLSFVPPTTKDAPIDYPFKELHDATRQIIKAYGPNRCVWGSDFPCELWCPKVTYAQHLRLFTHEMGLDESTQEWILGKTARGLWFADRDDK